MLGILLIFHVLPADIAYCSISENKTGEIANDITQLPLKYGKILEEKEIMLDSLPNGIALIPDINETPLSIFSFLMNQELQRNSYYPTVDSNESVHIETISEKIRINRMGDLIYNFNNEAQIAVSSMQVQFLGDGSLSNSIESIIDPNFKTFQLIPARLGFRYMIKTVDGKYGLFRIIALAKRAMMIQWIYQPDGSTNFTGTGNFLDREISNLWEEDTLTMNSALRKLRRNGIRICFETATANSNDDIQQVTNDINNVNVKALLDGLLKKTNRYKWESIEGTNIICIYPQQKSLLNQIVKKNNLMLPITNRSWLSVVKDMQLEKYNIRYPHWKGLSVFIGFDSTTSIPDRNTSISLNSDFSIKRILAEICWAYGDGMYFSLGQPENGTKGLIFVTELSSDKLIMLEDD
jgi:hypothetical protein